MEKEHVEYLDYVERVSTGEEPGPKLSKDEWRKKRRKEMQNGMMNGKNPPVKESALM